MGVKDVGKLTLQGRNIVVNYHPHANAEKEKRRLTYPGEKVSSAREWTSRCCVIISINDINEEHCLSSCPAANLGQRRMFIYLFRFVISSRYFLYILCRLHRTTARRRIIFLRWYRAWLFLSEQLFVFLIIKRRKRKKEKKNVFVVFSSSRRCRRTTPPPPTTKRVLNH